MLTRLHLTQAPNLEVIEVGKSICFKVVVRAFIFDADFGSPVNVWVKISNIHRHGDKGIYFEGACNGHEIVGHFWPGDIEKSWMTTRSDHQVAAKLAAA